MKKAIGFELEQTLFDISMKKISKISRRVKINFIHGIFDEYVDDDRYVYNISDATVVFNSLQPVHTEALFYRTQFRGKKVAIIKKDLPLLGYKPLSINKDDDNFWFFLNYIPNHKDRIVSKEKWAQLVLQDDKAKISNVYEYFGNQLKKRGFRKKSREESIDELKKEIRKSMPEK